MQRTPEPEVMDDQAQALAYAQAEFSEVNQGFVDRFAALWPGEAPARVLDLGCGPADIPIRFCRAHPGSRVWALDAARSMLALGVAPIREAGLSDRVQLVQAYLPDVPVAEGSCDAVISNSLLHHLANPLDLWRAVRAAARDGAPVLVCDLFRPETAAQAQQIVDEADCSDSEILRRDFYHSLLAAYTPDEIRAQLSAVGLSLAVETVSERHVLVTGRL